MFVYLPSDHTATNIAVERHSKGQMSITEVLQTFWKGGDYPALVITSTWELLTRSKMTTE